jgi:class 3 adenylate cyclase
MQSEEPQTAVGDDRRGMRAAVMVADMVEFSRRMEQDQVGSAD